MQENRFYNKNDFTDLDNNNQLFNKQINTYSNNNNKTITSFQKKEEKNRRFNNNQENNIIEKIRQKLKSRGIRGLLYLHRQFILSCPNINKISFNEFKNVLLGQHIILNDSEYNEVYYKYYNNNTFLLSPFIRLLIFPLLYTLKFF